MSKTHDRQAAIENFGSVVLGAHQRGERRYYLRGMDAWRVGLARTENPYTDGGWQHAAWDDGWAAARMTEGSFGRGSLGVSKSSLGKDSGEQLEVNAQRGGVRWGPQKPVHKDDLGGLDKAAWGYRGVRAFKDHVASRPLGYIPAAGSWQYDAWKQGWDRARVALFASWGPRSASFPAVAGADFGAALGRWDRFYNDSHHYTRWTTAMLPVRGGGKTMFTIQNRGRPETGPYELFQWTGKYADRQIGTYNDLGVAKAVAKSKYVPPTGLGADDGPWTDAADRGAADFELDNPEWADDYGDDLDAITDDDLHASFHDMMGG
jgi:hypothetical protein